MLGGRTCWLEFGQALVTFPKTPGLFGASVNSMLGTESSIGLATDDVWDTLVGLLDRFGRAAEDYAARFDIGIAPNEVRRQIEPILGDARRIQRAGWDSLPGGNTLRECLERLRELAPNTDRWRVRHPRPFSIPDDGGGHRPCDRGEFLVRDDAGLARRPARWRWLDVPRGRSTVRPMSPPARGFRRIDGRTGGPARRPHGTGTGWLGTCPCGGDTRTPRTSGCGR